ncbi:RHS repeat-associated core domain-containing protein [Phenylobacterium sp.]|uniref:RHS repeat-associated core domain-containing protein n=1 Tax=Phenylobacterium sp. TaxID=1871053 RepID=UPI0037CC7D2F
MQLMGRAAPQPEMKPHSCGRTGARRRRNAPALRRYVHGPGVDEPLVWYEGAGVADRRWLHADRQGSIIGVSNGAGAVTPYAYGPWGEPSDWTGPRFRYTGQAAFPEAQAYHYKARVYDPALGRFLQTDPIGQADDPNLYAYVRGDPVNGIDPAGTDAIWLSFTDGAYGAGHAAVVFVDQKTGFATYADYGSSQGDREKANNVYAVRLPVTAKFDGRGILTPQSMSSIIRASVKLNPDTEKSRADVIASYHPEADDMAGGAAGIDAWHGRSYCLIGASCVDAAREGMLGAGARIVKGIDPGPNAQVGRDAQWTGSPLSGRYRQHKDPKTSSAACPNYGASSAKCGSSVEFVD